MISRFNNYKKSLLVNEDEATDLYSECSTCLVRHRCPRREGKVVILNPIKCDYYYYLNVNQGLSGIPAVYRNVDITTTEMDNANVEAIKTIASHCDNIKYTVETGNWFYINGRSCGTGKTYLGCVLLNEFMFRNSQFIYSDEEGNMIPRSLFVSVPELLDRIRRSYKEEDEDLPVLLDRIIKAPFVLFDDIGCEKASEWTIERLYILINHRYVNNLATIFTSNFSLEEIADNVGQRTSSRLYSSFDIKLEGEDRRKK